MDTYIDLASFSRSQDSLKITMTVVVFCLQCNSADCCPVWLSFQFVQRLWCPREIFPAMISKGHTFLKNSVYAYLGYLVRAYLDLTCTHIWLRCKQAWALSRLHTHKRAHTLSLSLSFSLFLSLACMHAWHSITSSEKWHNQFADILEPIYCCRGPGQCPWLWWWSGRGAWRTICSLSKHSQRRPFLCCSIVSFPQHSQRHPPLR